MFTQSDPTARRRDATSADLAILSVSIEAERRSQRLLSEAEVRRTFHATSMRAWLGERLVRLGQAVLGVELRRHPATHHAR